VAQRAANIDELVRCAESNSQLTTVIDNDRMQWTTIELSGLCNLFNLSVGSSVHVSVEPSVSAYLSWGISLSL